MNLRQKGIKDIFTEFGKRLFAIWLSGKEGEGEYKCWHDNGQLAVHSFYKENNKRDGEFKGWHDNGQLAVHSLWKEGKKVRDIK